MGAHRVVIVGGGFGGLEAAKRLRPAPVRVTLIDRRNFHLFQPLLYQVATGTLSPANIAAPLREILKRQTNADVLLGDVVDIDAGARTVALREGTRVGYDTLVVATGASHTYFGKDTWAPLAPGLKTVEDATRIRARVLLAFETAERLRLSGAEPAGGELVAWLTFVVVGAGPTGVELAGALAEIARDTLRGNFRRINPAGARILLIEGTDRVLPTYPSTLSAHAAASLARLGVQVMLNARVVDIQPDRVAVQAGGPPESVPTRTVLWAAGVKASPLGMVMARAFGCQTDRAGRVHVGADLAVAGHPEAFVIGDLAHAEQDGRLLPGVAPVAIQEGRYVAHAVWLRLDGRTPPPFRYRRWGDMATIGRGHAVADLGRVQLAGIVAWLAWLFIHLMALVSFQNRLLVFLQWAWSYVSFNRSARLITETQKPADLSPPARSDR
jgi:NADH dehydrogenase